MTKFHKHDVTEVVNLTPIAYVTDRQIWSVLVTPQVKALLGKIVSTRIERKETTEGLFPGDEACNLNDHRLYGGKSGFVRYPYLVSIYKTENGAFIIKRDGVKFEAFAWFGDIEKGQAELMFKAALRDRRFDGTLEANDTALVDYPYDDPVLNKALPKEWGLKSVELSVYGFLPNSRVWQTCGDKEFDLFIEKPYRFLDRPELFLKYFQQAWTSNRAPGQNGAAIPDVSKLVPPRFEKIAVDRGYDIIEVAPSHFHVAMWALAVGYKFMDPAQKQIMTDLTAGIKRIKQERKLTRAQESWVAVIQHLRPVELIPAGLFLNGPQWPQDNIGPQNLWMYKTLTEKAAKHFPTDGAK